MHDNKIIAAPLRIAPGTSAAVRTRLLQLDTTLRTSTAGFSPADQAAFWRDLEIWCNANLAAIDGGAEAAATG
jgi:hypothetical protein